MSKYYPIVARAVQLVSKNFSSDDRNENERFCRILNDEAKRIYFDLQRSSSAVNVQSVAEKLINALKEKNFRIENQNFNESLPTIVEQSSMNETSSISVRVQREKSKKNEENLQRSNTEIFPKNSTSQKILVNVINDRRPTEKKLNENRLANSLSRTTTVEDLLRVLDRKQNKSRNSLISEKFSIDRTKIKPIKNVSNHRPTVKQQRTTFFSNSNSYSVGPTTYFQRQPFVYNDRLWFYPTQTTPFVNPTTQFYPYVYYTY